ncbi:molecular chaperone TorD family protein [Halodesulfurarchaeum sp. HSR-GB]|uniref:molecular chaperone TorD family protein n=1 Tax=Halodesulfurarchaeum sp. HSR-GB TaxID=3074077 RepID=UPI00286742D7|nr:molecular chaperone TorD family protein [Halodesulfurarchaeum sp. HSR-GB]MDR5656436.1 molecular chaperone TorD family protein [Halodesulfurarchaeum sp. HSR-GB]
MTTTQQSTPSVTDAAEAARGTVYGTLARLYEEPDEKLYEVLADGTLFEELGRLIEESALAVSVPTVRTDEDYELLCARFNDVFVVGYPDPPVPRYESEYVDRGWNDTNLDLARAYEYFDLEVDERTRDHHDYLPYELEFVGYLARLAATGEDGATRARADFLDRHLEPFVAGLEAAIDEEVGTGIYDPIVSFTAAFVRADLAALDDEVTVE